VAKVDPIALKESQRNSIHQSGNFAVGVNQGEIKTEKLAATINETQATTLMGQSPAGQRNVSSAPKVMVNAIDHAQRFLFGWQLITVLIGLLMAAIVGIGSQIDFDNLLPKQKEPTTQQESNQAKPKLKNQPSQPNSTPVEN
jgi:hypothetical protein